MSKLGTWVRLFVVEQADDPERTANDNVEIAEVRGDELRGRASHRRDTWTVLDRVATTQTWDDKPRTDLILTFRA